MGGNTGSSLRSAVDGCYYMYDVGEGGVEKGALRN